MVAPHKDVPEPTKPPLRPPNLEEIIRRGQERFKEKEPKGLVLTVEHQKSIEKACLFFGGLFLGTALSLMLFC